MDVPSVLGGVKSVLDNPIVSTAVTVFGGGLGGVSLLFTGYKVADKVVDGYFKRRSPERFFERLVSKSEWFANWIVKSIRFFDDKLIDPVKSVLPESGERLENVLNSRICQMQKIFNKAFDTAKMVVKDKA